MFGNKEPRPACNSSGKVNIPDNSGTCQICEGKGKIMEFGALEPTLCRNCNGQGIVEIPSIGERNGENRDNIPNITNNFYNSHVNNQFGNNNTQINNVYKKNNFK